MAKEKLKYGIFGNYSGKVGNLVFEKNGNVRIQKILPKRIYKPPK